MWRNAWNVTLIARRPLSVCRLSSSIGIVKVEANNDNNSLTEQTADRGAQNDDSHAGILCPIVRPDRGTAKTVRIQVFPSQTVNHRFRQPPVDVIRTYDPT